MRDWKKEYEERRQAEIEVGMRRVKLYGLLENCDRGTQALRAAFPTLTIDVVMNKPYTHVTIRVQPAVKLAPLDSPAVLTDEELLDREVYFDEPIEDYPSDHLTTKLALIA